MFSMHTALGHKPPLNVEQLTEKQTAIRMQDLNLFYGQKQALHSINMSIPKHQVTAFIGASGCGKSGLLACINRMNDFVDDAKVTGQVLVNGEDIYQPHVDVSRLRREVGMVFQKPNPFPKSIYENVVYGLRLQGIKDGRMLDELAEKALQAAGLWHEVKDALNDKAIYLSGGQQQRLVIARAIALSPKILLLDEPTSALDPTSTLMIESLIRELKEKYTVVLVTHNMQQAARVSDYTAFLHMGELVEYRDTDSIFTSPVKKRTEDYITGRTAN